MTIDRARVFALACSRSRVRARVFALSHSRYALRASLVRQVMRCGCAKDGKTAGACTDLGQKVLNLANNQVLKIDRELKAPSPPFNGPCQQLPQVFLDSGTADSGANFDELWDAAMGSPCASDPNLEWMGRDCRDSFIPGKGAEGDPSVQDRSDPSRSCSLECATLYLKVAELCPRVYQLLRLDQLKPICPELASVMIEPLPGGPVPIDGSVAPVTTAGVPAPAVAPVIPAVAVAPVPVAEVPAVAPVAVAEVPAVVAVPPTGPVVVAVAPQPAPSASSALSVSAVSVLVCVCSWMAALL